MNINKKLDFSLRLILGLICFFSIPYFFTLIDEKYEKSIPQLFWFIIFLISFSFFIVKKNKILAYGFFFIFIAVQLLLLQFPPLHDFVYNLFA
jgi:hypothetical protein